MKLFEDLDKLLTETRAGSARQAEHLESAGAYVRKKEDEVVQAHERMRDLEAAIAQKNQHIGAVETQLKEAGQYLRDKEQEFRDAETKLQEAGRQVRDKEQEFRAAETQLQEAGRYIRHKEQEFSDVEAQLRKAVELGETREKVMREGEERLRTLGASTRTIAQVGVLALKAQERILHGALRPLLERLHALLDPEGVLRLPADGASFAELIENVHRSTEGLRTAAEELEWRRPMQAELTWHKEELGRVRAELERTASDLATFRTEVATVRTEVERQATDLARAKTELGWRRAEMQRLVSQGWLRLFLRPGKLRRRLARWRARPDRKEKP
jgi:septal ring factor EnvC (AmiA/AmiB activator)